MSLSRKDYVQVADILRQDNPNFNPDRFRKAAQS